MILIFYTGVGWLCPLLYILLTLALPIYLGEHFYDDGMYFYQSWWMYLGIFGVVTLLVWLIGKALNRNQTIYNVKQPWSDKIAKVKGRHSLFMMPTQHYAPLFFAIALLVYFIIVPGIHYGEEAFYKPRGEILTQETMEFPVPPDAFRIEKELSGEDHRSYRFLTYLTTDEIEKFYQNKYQKFEYLKKKNDGFDSEVLVADRETLRITVYDHNPPVTFIPKKRAVYLMYHKLPPAMKGLSPLKTKPYKMPNFKKNKD